MSITNGYTTLENIMVRLDPLTSGSSGSPADTNFIERAIEGVSRWIDGETGRQFFCSSGSRLYDVPDDEELYFDCDFYSVAGITNGDGTALTTLDYRVMPTNSTPKYGVELKDSSLNVWMPDAYGDEDAVISVAGSIGYSPTAPFDIREACEDIVTNVYKRRDGNNSSAESIVTAGGLVITPRDISTMSRKTLNRYQRMPVYGA
jgi:hypothetical protein